MKLQIRQARAIDLPDVLALQADSLRKLSVGYYTANKIESLVRTQASARSQYFTTGAELLYIGEMTDGKNVRMVRSRRS